MHADQKAHEAAMALHRLAELLEAQGFPGVIRERLEGLRNDLGDLVTEIRRESGARRRLAAGNPPVRVVVRRITRRT